MESDMALHQRELWSTQSDHKKVSHQKFSSRTSRCTAFDVFVPLVVVHNKFELIAIKLIMRTLLCSEYREVVNPVRHRIG